MIADRVGQYTDTVGLNSFQLQAVLPMHRSFREGLGYSKECYYTCLNEASGQWEIGIGRFSKSADSNEVLERTEVLSSSSGGGPVSFSSGKKMVFVSLPAKAVTSAMGAGISQIQGIKVHNNPNPSGEGSLGIDGQLYAARIHNPVWNDVVDFQKLNDRLVPGLCYFDTIEGARVCTERCQKSAIGVASDTYGIAVGKRQDQPQVPIAVAGWVLAYTDRVYDSGTPLTNDHRGFLTEMTMAEKHDYPERLLGIFKKPEYDLEFGLDTKVKVDGRCWVKVK